MTDNGPAVVTPDKRSRLAQLHAQYVDAKAAADEAASRLKAITDGIKSELNSIAPEERRVQLVANGLPTLQLTYVERWTVDAKKLKDEDPTTYVRYARKSGTHQLRVIAGGDR